jgi:diguanylate cyclase (GGDEF)-like protein
VLFVFLSTFLTAALVSGVSIQATHGHLGRMLDRTYPSSLDAAAERVAEALARDAPPGELAAQLASQAIPPGGLLLLLDANARVVAASRPLTPETIFPAAALAPDGRREVRTLRDASGRDWVGSVRALGAGGRRLALVAPFDVAFEPVVGVVTRIFVIDVCIVLLASFLALRVTAVVLHPIEVLSDAARLIAQGHFAHEVQEPPTRDELGLLARTFNDMLRRLRRQQAEIEDVNRDLRERNTELQQAKESFEQLSITDGLTRLHNHRYFQDQLTREIRRVERSGEPLAMLLIDLDDFKQLNDRLGHAAGDELLAGVASTLNQSVRASDLLARYGGEEFVVLAPDTDREGAYRLAEKLRTAIAESAFVVDDSERGIRVTVSVGVARYTGNRKGFFNAADRALYRAKDQGKNCVVLDEELAGSPR